MKIEFTDGFIEIKNDIPNRATWGGEILLSSLSGKKMNVSAFASNYDGDFTIKSFYITENDDIIIVFEGHGALTLYCAGG